MNIRQELATKRIALVIENLRLLEKESDTAAWQRADDPHVDLTEEIEMLQAAIADLTRVGP